MGWRLARWCLVLALGCGLASPAAAQTSSKDVAARIAKLRREANTLYGRSDPAAVEMLREVWELSNSYIDLCNLGKFELDLGREWEAAAHLSMCVARIPSPDVERTGPLRRAAERYLKMARALSGAIEIEVNALGAETLIDGESTGKISPRGPIYVEPGWHDVEVRAPGFAPDIRRVEARAGIPVRLKMQLTKVEPEQKQESDARPAAAATSSADVSPIGVSPIGVSPMSAPHRDSPWTGPLIAGIALGVAGTAVAIGGFAVAGAAYSDANEAGGKLNATGFEEPCSAPRSRELCKEYTRASDRIVPFVGLGVGGIAVAGVGGALLLYELVGASSHSARNAHNAMTSPRAAILVTPRGSALMVTGSF